jgi:WD40 repeat protein
LRDIKAKVEASAGLSADESQELAYLAKALRLNGGNSEAGALTAALLTQESWPVETGVMKHDDRVTSAQFSADGQRVVTASLGPARVWDVPTITTKNSADDVNLLSDLAEATAGLAFQAFGQTEILAALTPDQVKATRDRIAVKFSGSGTGKTLFIFNYCKYE